MDRRRRIFALFLALPLAIAPAACGGDDADRSALEQDELDRDLELALQGDSLPATFEDTAATDAPAPQPQAQRPAASPPRQTTQPRPSPTQPQTQPRPQAPQPRTVTQTVPTGTTFAVRMNDQLSTETSRVGDAFTATLTDPIIDAAGNVIVPAGAVVRGRVTAVSPSTRVGQTAALKLAFEAISWGGESHPLQASVERADVQQSSRTSRTETYAAITLNIESRRWAGVPFYIRAGKRLGRRVTEVAVVFKRAPHLPFHDTSTEELTQNALVIRVQPDEGVTMRFGSKVPGTAMEIRDVSMDFAYGGSFTESSPEAYERLILDVLLGEEPLFPRHEEVELSWKILDPVIAHWARKGKPEAYDSGTWGPASADKMLARDGRTWRRP